MGRKAQDSGKSAWIVSFAWFESRNIQLIVSKGLDKLTGPPENRGPKALPAPGKLASTLLKRLN